MKPEYREGPEVMEKFEQAMKVLFQTPKLAAEPKKKPTVSATSRKPKSTDKD
ncbi:MAG: hypothetical protein ACHP9V_03130 [Terriglobales bacterium]